jgi:hypothetical protein
LRLLPSFSSICSSPCTAIISPSTFSEWAVCRLVFSKICSSDLILDEWIHSLFNADTIRMISLDFRLIAASVFRLIAAQCTYFIESIESKRTRFSFVPLVSSHVLSRASFNTRANDFIEKFIKELVHGVISSKASSELTMSFIRQCDLASAIHTNVFTMIVPGSNRYRRVNNFYPIHGNATFDDVIEVPYRAQSLVLSLISMIDPLDILCREDLSVDKPTLDENSSNISIILSITCINIDNHLQHNQYSTISSRNTSISRANIELHR